MSNTGSTFLPRWATRQVPRELRGQASESNSENQVKLPRVASFKSCVGRGWRSWGSQETQREKGFKCYAKRLRAMGNIGKF